MTNERIISNKIQCNKCGKIVESKHRHDFVWCDCRSVAADGGTDYLKRVGSWTDWTELSEVEEYE